MSRCGSAKVVVWLFAAELSVIWYSLIESNPRSKLATREGGSVVRS
jgi:hypothetical protein